MSEPTASPEPVTSPEPGPTRRRRCRIDQDGPGCWSPSTRCSRCPLPRGAGVQLATKFGHAPVAYLLSAFAGVVYIVATVTLVNGSPTARRIAVLSCSIEFAGVLAVGTWSVPDPATFPDATVWSGYGVGYGYVPLVLPVFGLLWLRRWTKRARSRQAAMTSPGNADGRT